MPKSGWLEEIGGEKKHSYTSTKVPEVRRKVVGFTPCTLPQKLPRTGVKVSVKEKNILGKARGRELFPSAQDYTEMALHERIEVRFGPC